MKKIKYIFLLFPLLLTGCSFNTSIDSLLAPPKLSDQQEHIYQALTSYTGSNISLKYPKSGDNLSAFIVDDIDGDSQDEAIVFYEKNSIKTEDNPLRINILDQVDSGWMSVCDYAADGNEIEKVMITKLGESERVNIIAGYSLINQSEKVVSIYDYTDGVLNTSFSNDYYSLFDAADLNGDNKKELFIAQNQSASRRPCAMVYTLEKSGEYSCSSVELNEGYIGYKNIRYGISGENVYEIFLDCETTGGSVVTEVLTLDSRNNLSVLFSPNVEKSETLRPSSYLSRDIDSDGTIEIPVPVLCAGSSSDDESPVYLTHWYKTSGEGKIELKYQSYMSITDGYVFMIPEELYDNVTVQTDNSSGETRLCCFEKSLDDCHEIFSLKIVTDNEAAEELINEEYELLHSRGDKKFFIKVNKENETGYTPGEIMMKFRFDD